MILTKTAISCCETLGLATAAFFEKREPMAQLTMNEVKTHTRLDGRLNPTEEKQSTDGDTLP